MTDSRNPEETVFDYCIGGDNLLSLTLEDGSAMKPYYPDYNIDANVHSIYYFWDYREKNADAQYEHALYTTVPNVPLEQIVKGGELEVGKTYYILCSAVEQWHSTNDYLISYTSNPLEVTIVETPRQNVDTIALESTGEVSANSMLGQYVVEYPSCVQKCGISWYVAGRLASILYHDWKKACFDQNVDYSLYIYLDMCPGQIFTEETQVTLNGEPMEVISVSSDGREATVKAAFHIPCSHKGGEWEHDDATHFKKCRICGEVMESDAHFWGYVSGRGADAKYQCSVCDFTMVLGERYDTIYRAHVKLGYCYVGETRPMSVTPYTAGDASCFEVYYYTFFKYSSEDKVSEEEPLEDDTYLFTVWLQPIKGFAFKENESKILCEINGSLVEADSWRLVANEVISADFKVTPVTPPEVIIKMPSEIRAGDDLVKKSTESAVIYNGKKADNVVTFISENGELLMMNYCIGGKWTSTDLDTLLKENASYTEKERAEIREMMSAKPGSVYSFTAFSTDTDTIKVLSSTPDRIKVDGAEQAVHLTMGKDNSFSCCAVYVPNGGDVGEVNLVTTAPIFDHSPDTSHGEKWNTYAYFTCGEKYTVTFTVDAKEGQTFTEETIATVNGFAAEVKFISSKQIEVSYTFREIPHCDSQLTVNETCTEDGYSLIYCSKCGADLARTVIPARGHNYTEIEAVEPTCTDVGNVAYMVCDYCGDIICDRASVYLPFEYSNHVGGVLQYDEESHWVLCECEKHIEEEKHSFVDGYCEVCKYGANKVIILEQPVSANVSDGDRVVFSVKASAAAVGYCWQESDDGGKSWKDSSVTGNATDTITITADSNKSGWKYRCLIYDAASEITGSNVATLTVESSGPAITTQPKSVTVQEGEKATFTVVAAGTGLTYKWERCISGTKWETVEGTTNTKTVTATAVMNGWKYRVTVTDDHLKMTTSEPATLTVGTGIVITSQPKDITAKIGTSISFTVVASGEGLTYQWQYRNAGASAWSKSGIAAAKTANMKFTVGTDKTLNGRQYQCVITDKYGKSVTSEIATLTVGTATGPVITSQPVNVSASVGDTVHFTIVASGEGLTYRWQYKNAGGLKWSDSSVAAAKTNDMTFKVGTDSTLNGRQYQCVITDKNGKTVTSNIVTLTIGKASGPVIEKQPGNVESSVGSTVHFTVNATGEELTYQWQFRNVGADAWSNSGIKAAKTANMTFKVGSDKTLNGRQYQCVITDRDGNQVTSNIVSLTVDAASGPKITSQPANVTAAVNESVSFKVTATGEELKYQWEYQNVGSSTWSKSGIAAAKTSEMKFTVGSDKTLNGRKYRCVVTDKNGKTVTSSEATLTVK